MNILSAVSRDNNFFSSFIVGAFFLLGMVVMLSIVNIISFVNLKDFLFLKEKPLLPDWGLILLGVLISFIIGEFLLNTGDLFISWKFSNKFLRFPETAESADSFISFSSGERSSSPCSYPPRENIESTGAFEKITERSQYLLTPDVFLCVDESYQTNVSDYYYARSRLFSAVFISLIFLFSVPFLVDVLISYEATISLTFRKLDFLLFTITIGKIWLVIITLIWPVLVFLLAKLLPISNKLWNFLLKMIFYILLFIPASWIFPEISDVSITPYFKLLQIYVFVIFVILLLMCPISYFLAVRYRRYANFFLYLAYLKSLLQKRKSE